MKLYWNRSSQFFLIFKTVIKTLSYKIYTCSCFEIWFTMPKQNNKVRKTIIQYQNSKKGKNSWWQKHGFGIPPLNAEVSWVQWKVGNSNVVMGTECIFSICFLHINLVADETAKYPINSLPVIMETGSCLKHLVSKNIYVIQHVHDQSDLKVSFKKCKIVKI